MDWLSETTGVEVQGREHIYTIGIKARAFRKNGSLRAIPPGFSASGEPQLPHGREGLLNTRITDRLNPGHNPQVHIGRGANHIRMSALGTANVAGAAVLDANGNVIGRRFDGAWTGADLEWIDIGHRVKKHIYLHEGHPRVFEIRVDDRAGNLVASPRGWDLLDDNDNPVLFATPGYLFKPSDPSALTLPVKTTVRVQGGKSIYTYTLPAPLPGKSGWAGWTLDPTWESQPGAAEGQDTWISAVYPTRNYGLDVGLWSGESSGPMRGLLQFALSLPSGTPISAICTLQHFYSDQVTTQSIELHRAITQWYEGAKDDAAPDAGQDGSTYNLRNANGAVAWAGGAGGGSGTDRVATATASTPVTAWGAYTWNVLADIQNWAATPSNNFGWWSINANESIKDNRKRLASSDHATAAWRPKLTVVTVEQQRRNRNWWFGLIGGLYAA